MSRFEPADNFRLAFDFMSEAILLLDNETCIRYVNPMFLRSFEFQLEQVMETSASQLISEQHPPHFFRDIVGQLAESGHWSGKCWIGKTPELDALCSMQIDAVYESDTTVSCYIVRLHKNLEGEEDIALQELAYHDSLTGLANRALFNQLLKHEISHAERQSSQFALLFIDLDKFKEVNDSLGHDAGDFLLCTIAQRLESTLRKSDVVGRMGGDEFVVILSKINDLDTISNVVEKLIREIRKPVHIEAHQMLLGCSVGISVYPDNGAKTESLMQHADIAMYRAKQQGGSSYFYFSDELNQELLDHKRMEEQIKQSLEENRFVPYFQPLLDERDGKLAGVECLMRWQHPQRGTVNPLEFIPVAKKSGLMQRIFAQMLEGAFKQLKLWPNVDHQNIPLSVNITSQQFYEQETFDLMHSLLKKYGLRNGAIRIEVTESTLQEKGHGLMEQLEKINQFGFGISLDDFGTGYSSMRYLQQVPVDTLKIDRSFVRNLENNPHDKIIVKAIIQLAKTLNIKVVAEGVETTHQMRFLAANDCHIMQGFLFSPALPADEFAVFLETL